MNPILRFSSVVNARYFFSFATIVVSLTTATASGQAPRPPRDPRNEPITADLLATSLRIDAIRLRPAGGNDAERQAQEDHLRRAIATTRQHLRLDFTREAGAVRWDNGVAEFDTDDDHKDPKNSPPPSRVELKPAKKFEAPMTKSEAQAIKPRAKLRITAAIEFVPAAALQTTEDKDHRTPLYNITLDGKPIGYYATKDLALSVDGKQIVGPAPKP